MIVQCSWQPYLFKLTPTAFLFWMATPAAIPAVKTLPAFLPEPFIVTSKALPRECFGEPQNDDGVRYVEQVEGICEVCSLHCPVMTEPQPARLWRMTCGRKACALCYQFDRTAQQVRRLGTNTIHHIFFMKQLEQMENHAASLIEHDPGLLKPVVQCNADQVRPSAFNKHGVPVRPPMTTQLDKGGSGNGSDKDIQTSVSKGSQAMHVICGKSCRGKGSGKRFAADTLAALS